MALLSNTSSCHSPSSCSRDRTCRSAPHAACCRQAPSPERWASNFWCCWIPNNLLINVDVYRSVFSPTTRAPKWKWKASSFLRSSVIPQAYQEAPTGERKRPWLINSDALHTYISDCFHFFHAFFFLLIRPGSASPSGKASGPGGPVGPLPTHFPQQVFTFKYVNTTHWKSHPGMLFLCVSAYLLIISSPQQVPPAQGSMVMHRCPPTTGPFPSPIQRPVMQVNKPIIIRSPPYPNPGREPPHATPPSAPEPPVKGPEDGMKVSHPL